MVNQSLQTKCAKITGCRFVDDGKVLYYADACKGNENFIHEHDGYLFPAQPGEKWTCPNGHYVKIKYSTTSCPAEGNCYAHGMYPVKDIEYVKEHCW